MLRLLTPHFRFLQASGAQGTEQKLGGRQEQGKGLKRPWEATEEGDNGKKEYGEGKCGRKYGKSPTGLDIRCHQEQN